MIHIFNTYLQKNTNKILKIIKQKISQLDKLSPRSFERNYIANDILKLAMLFAKIPKPLQYTDPIIKREETILQLSLGSALDIGINTINNTVTVQAGGKAINHFRACHNSLGIPSDLLAISAKDHSGELFEDLLRTDENVASLKLFPFAETMRINIHLDDKLYSTPGPEINSAELESFLKEFEIKAEHTDWLILAGSVYPGIPEDIFTKLISKYGDTKKIIVDSRELWDKDIIGTSRPFLIKPNMNEFIRLAKKYYPLEAEKLTAKTKPQEIVTLAEKFVTKKKIPVVIVTKDDKPFIALTKNNKFLVTPPRIEKNSDIGSGDALLVGLLDIFTREKLTENIPENFFKQALRHATAFAAASAECPGSSFAQNPQRILALEKRIKIENI